MKIHLLSPRYQVRYLSEDDVAIMYQLAVNNQLFYQHCLPMVTIQSLKDDLKALPPNTTYDDKFFLGFFKEDKLVAMLDLILNFPNEQTAFIGLFMLDIHQQNHGEGTKLYHDIENYLRSLGYRYIRLGYIKTNPQSKHFWYKNGFEPTNVQSQQERYTIVYMQKELF